MGALLTSEHGLALLKGRLAQAGGFPGQGCGFASGELEPILAQSTTRPIAPAQGSRQRGPLMQILA
jgi:hypothetical protein